MKFARAIVFGICFVAILTMGCEPGEEKIAEIPPTDLLLAEEVMERTIATYEECATYRDTGTVTRTFHAEENTQRETQTFRTVFERPYRFRFECREDEKRYIIAADAAAVRAWWGVQEGIQPMSSLDEAIALAVGPSNGASHTIPRLLMPGRVRGRSLEELGNIERLTDALLEDVPCYRLRGTDNSGAPYVVWIERGTFVVRCIDEEHPFSDFTTTDRTVYAPELNPELPDDAFQLKAPVAETGKKKMTAQAF